MLAVAPAPPDPMKALANLAVGEADNLEQRLFTAMDRSGYGLLSLEDLEAAIAVARELRKEKMDYDGGAESAEESLPDILCKCADQMKKREKISGGLRFDDFHDSCGVSLRNVAGQAEEMVEYLTADLFTVFNKGSAAYTLALLISCTIQIVTITQNIPAITGAVSSCVLVLMGIACIPPMDQVRWAMGGRGHRQMFFELRRLLPSADNGSDSFHIKATWILAIMYMVFLPSLWVSECRRLTTAVDSDHGCPSPTDLCARYTYPLLISSILDILRILVLVA
jgi:hypothetical protein